MLGLKSFEYSLQTVLANAKLLFFPLFFLEGPRLPVPHPYQSSKCPQGFSIYGSLTSLRLKTEEMNALMQLSMAII